MLSRLAALIIATTLLAQDPYTLLPRNYHLELENNYVRISRVLYEPGDRLPKHVHPAIPTIYIYLRDAGPVRFRHITPHFTLERRAVQAGQVRFSRNARQETHEVDYLGDSPNETLRIELKTEPDRPHRDARIRADDNTPWEDAQVRISREAGPVAGPAVIVNVPDRTFVWVDAKRSATAGDHAVVIGLRSKRPAPLN